MHWINFPLLLIMIWSGFRIYWSNDVYSISLGTWTPFRFFPDPFNETLELNRRLAKGIAYHLNFGWFFVLNGVAYTAFLVKSGEWRHIVPDRKALGECKDVVLHDLHLKKSAPAQGRYNAMQQVAYTTILVMATVLVLSGFAIYKPTQLSLLTSLLGGYETARLIHFTMTMGIVLFFFIHLLQVARSGWKNFAGMVTGYELEPSVDDPPGDPEPDTADTEQLDQVTP